MSEDSTHHLLRAASWHFLWWGIHMLPHSGLLFWLLFELVTQCHIIISDTNQECHLQLVSVQVFFKLAYSIPSFLVWKFMGPTWQKHYNIPTLSNYESILLKHLCFPKKWIPKHVSMELFFFFLKKKSSLVFQKIFSYLFTFILLTFELDIQIQSSHACLRKHAVKQLLS